LQVVQIAREAGLVKLAMVEVDGSKILVNASKHKVMGDGRMRDTVPNRTRERRRSERSTAASHAAADIGKSYTPLRPRRESVRQRGRSSPALEIVGSIVQGWVRIQSL